MSASPVNPTATAAILANDGLFALLHCPLSGCDSPFTATGDTIPVSLSCGHVCCHACATAMTFIDPPQCLICKSIIDSSFVVDTGIVSLLNSLTANGSVMSATVVDNGLTAGNNNSADVSVLEPMHATGSDVTVATDNTGFTGATEGNGIITVVTVPTAINSGPLASATVIASGACGVTGAAADADGDITDSEPASKKRGITMTSHSSCTVNNTCIGSAGIVTCSSSASTVTDDAIGTVNPSHEHLMEHMTSSQSLLSSGVNTFREAMPVLQAARDRMIERHNGLVARLDAELAVAPNPVKNAFITNAKLELQKALNASLKGIDAQLDSW